MRAAHAAEEAKDASGVEHRVNLKLEMMEATMEAKLEAKMHQVLAFKMVELENKFGARLWRLEKDVANAAHRSDLMRIDVLEEHGGIYVDHDAFVLRSLSQLRRCTGTGVRAGYEYFSRDRHKLNNGVLLARPGARFLSLWREAYSKDFRPSEWDYNSCVVPFQLARRSAARS